MNSFTCFFFNDTATTEIYTLSLHDALPIFNNGRVAAYFYSDFCVVHKGRSFIQETYEEHINPNPDISTGYIHKVFKKDHKSEDGRYPATASLSFDLKIHKPDSTSSFSARSEERRVGKECR